VSDRAWRGHDPGVLSRADAVFAEKEPGELITESMLAPTILTWSAPESGRAAPRRSARDTPDRRLRGERPVRHLRRRRRLSAGHHHARLAEQPGRSGIGSRCAPRRKWRST
jgi:hypothetical protein